MMTDPLQLVTHGVLVLVLGIVLVHLARRPSLPQLEIAALFGTLAATIVLQGLTRTLGLQLPWAGTVGILLLIAHPFLLARLVEHFRPVSLVQKVIIAVALLSSWAIVLAGAASGATVGTVFLVLAFVYVEGYATVAFFTAIKSARGVSRPRLIAVALGSGMLALAILVSGLAVVLPSISAVASPLSRVLAIGTAIGYYIGLAPPRWLRRAWQLAEFERFLAHLAGRSVRERLSAVFDQFGPAAARSVGGRNAIVVVAETDDGSLVVRPDGENARALAEAAIDRLELGASSPHLTRVWREQRALVTRDPTAWGASLRRVAAAFGGAQAALIAPLIVDQRPYGLLIILLERGHLFLDDELELLALLSDQVALALENGRLFSEAERRAAEHHQAQRVADDANRLKSQFLANMSHELRTPLNAIIGFSELLLDEPEDGYQRGRRTGYLETIHRSGEHLLTLINDILDLAKVEAGRMELKLADVNLAEVISDLVASMMPRARTGGVTLAVDVPPVTVLADEAKLKQILYNLVSNAVKFTPPGGRVDVIGAGDDGEITITVADTGIGIAPEDHERIFEEFQQVDGGAGRQHEGTGLGLALTRRLVQLHGGRIWMTSAVGQGSRFHVVLPSGVAAAELGERGVPDAVDHPGPAPSSPDGRSLVLIVEDDPQAAKLLALYLERGGYRSETVANGRDAVIWARALQPAAITLDVLLPSIDGWAVLRSLKLDEETRDIPVVIVSVVDDQPLGRALGAVDYFVKPVDRQALLDRIGRYVPVSSRGTNRILIVDDDAATLTLMADYLRPAGFDVLLAAGGAEGIASARDGEPDIVILDLMMPTVSGFDVVAALRADPATRQLPIIIVTAKDITEAERRLLNGQVAMVLQKGTFAAEDLVDWLNRLTGRVGVGSNGR